MAKQNSNTSAPAEKPKRKVLTPAERIAKLEAELEAARNRGADKDRKALVKLNERRDKLVERQGKVNAELADVNSDIEAIKQRLGDEPAAEATEPSEG